MTDRDLTDSELLVLGLVAEMPRHGYELERVIDQRGMREWTQIGFSSIYYVLGKLGERGLVQAETPPSSRAKKSYRITGKGRETLKEQTIAALQTVRPSYPSLLLGMLHWPVLTREQALAAVQTRQYALAQELKRIKGIHFEQQPLPDYVDAVFEFSIGQLKAEADWIARTLAYMETKPWGE